MSFVTTDPAPITTSSHTVTGITVALVPTLTRSPNRVLAHWVRSPRAGPPMRNGSLMNMAPWLMKQSAPISTSSQMKAWIAPGAWPNGHSALDFNEGTNKNAIPKRATVDVRWFDDGHAFSARHVDDAGLQTTRLVADGIPSSSGTVVGQHGIDNAIHLFIFEKGEHRQGHDPVARCGRPSQAGSSACGCAAKTG